MRGRGKKTEELLREAIRLLAENHPQTVRQLHYRIVSEAKIDYRNTQSNYKRLCAVTSRRGDLI